MKKDLVQQVPLNIGLVKENDGFDWDSYIENCPTRLRRANPHIKAPKGIKVFSHAKNAQTIYNQYTGTFSDMINNVSIGDRLTGKIWSIDEKWATIDVGYRELIYIDLDKEEHAFREIIEKNQEFSVKVTATHNEKGFCIGSVTEGTKQVIFNELLESIDSQKSAYIGRVNQMIPGGGYNVTVNGVECFMPGSLAGINKLADFGSIIGKDLYVVPVSYSNEKGTIVVSHRKYLQAMIPNTIDVLKENADKEYTGYITGSTKYGVFVEFNDCLTGMIHVNDLDGDIAESYNSGKLSPGTEIKFFIKDIISDTKITLTQKSDSRTNPWNGASGRYTFPAKVQGIVKSIKDYGLFIEIEEGITGLLHSSEISDVDTSSIKKGDQISVIITRIEEETRKVFLKLV
jgi:small subunit ribosomal protein S1